MVTSTHKTLTAFTQGSIVLARGGAARPGPRRGVRSSCCTPPARRPPSWPPPTAPAQLIEDARPAAAGRTIELVADGPRPAAPDRRAARVGGVRSDQAGAGRWPAPAPTASRSRPTCWRDGVRLEMADRDTLVPIVTLADTAGHGGPAGGRRWSDSVAARRGAAAAAGRLQRLVAAAGGRDQPARGVLRAPRAGPRRSGGGPGGGRDGGALPARHPGAGPGRADHRPRSSRRCGARRRPAAGSPTAPTPRWRRCWWWRHDKGSGFSLTPPPDTMRRVPAGRRGLAAP